MRSSTPNLRDLASATPVTLHLTMPLDLAARLVAYARRQDDKPAGVALDFIALGLDEADMWDEADAYDRMAARGGWPDA